MRTIAIGNNEYDEFMAIVGRHSKWGQRLADATSFYAPESDSNPSMSLIPQSAWLQPGYIGTGTGIWHAPLIPVNRPLNPRHPNPEKMPEVLHVGRRVRWFTSSSTAKHPKYETGTIHSHYISGDDCSSYWGRQCYTVRQDKNGELLSPLGPDVCEFIDGPTPVYFPYRWGMGAENPRPDWIGKKIRVVGKYVRAGPSGNPLVAGQTGTISRISPITCAWAFWVTPTGGGQDFSVNPTDCEFIDFL